MAKKLRLYPPEQVEIFTDRDEEKLKKELNDWYIKNKGFEITCRLMDAILVDRRSEITITIFYSSAMPLKIRPLEQVEIFSGRDQEKLKKELNDWYIKNKGFEITCRLRNTVLVDRIREAIVAVFYNRDPS
jgi:hypothetical protein